MKITPLSECYSDQMLAAINCIFGGCVSGYTERLLVILQECAARSHLTPDLDVIVETDDVCLPLNILESSDAGLIPTIFFGLGEFETVDKVSNKLDKLGFLASAGLEYCRDGCYNSILNLEETFEKTQTRHIKRMSRAAFQKNEEKYVTVFGDEFQPLYFEDYESNFAHHAVRDNDPETAAALCAIMKEKRLTYDNFSRLPGRKFVRLYLRDLLVGYVTGRPHRFIDDIWVYENAYFRRDSETAADNLGNYLVFKIIQQAFKEGKRRVDMGINIFPYKALWTKETMPYAGVRFTPDSPLIAVWEKHCADYNANVRPGIAQQD